MHFVYRAIFLTFSFFTVSLSASNAPAFISNCNVPYVLQYTIMRLKKNEATDQMAALKELRMMKLFKEPSKLAIDLETTIDVIANICGIQSQNMYRLLSDAYHSSRPIEAFLNEQKVVLTSPSHFDFSIVGSHLKTIVSLYSALTKDEMEPGFKYIRACILLLSECEADVEKRAELARILRSTFTQLVPAKHVEDRSFSIIEEDTKISIIDDQKNTLPAIYYNDPLYCVVLMFLKRMEPYLSGAFQDWMEYLRKERDVVLTEYMEMKKNNVNPLTEFRPKYNNNSGFYQKLKAGAQHSDKTPLPYHLLALLDLCNRYMEEYRILMFLNLTYFHQLMHHPFEVLQKAKRLGDTGNVLGRMSSFHLIILGNFLYLEDFLNPHRLLPPMVDLEGIPTQKLWIEEWKPIFYKMPNLSLIPDLKNSRTALVGKEFDPVCWMPHAFMLIAKETIKCPIKIVQFEAGLFTVFSPLIDNIKSGQLDKIQASLNLIQSVVEVCLGFDFYPQNTDLALIRKHFDTAAFLTKRNLTRFAPTSLSTVTSLSSFAKAQLDFVGVLFKEKIDSETVKTILTAFQFYIDNITATWKLSVKDEYVVEWAKYYMKKWLRITARKSLLTSGESTRTATVTAPKIPILKNPEFVNPNTVKPANVYPSTTTTVTTTTTATTRSATPKYSILKRNVWVEKEKPTTSVTPKPTVTSTPNPNDSILPNPNFTPIPKQSVTPVTHLSTTTTTTTTLMPSTSSTVRSNSSTTHNSSKNHPIEPDYDFDLPPLISDDTIVGSDLKPTAPEFKPASSIGSGQSAPFVLPKDTHQPNIYNGRAGFNRIPLFVPSRNITYSGFQVQSAQQPAEWNLPSAQQPAEWNLPLDD